MLDRLRALFHEAESFEANGKLLSVTQFSYLAKVIVTSGFGTMSGHHFMTYNIDNITK